jgi:hypothetical protein
MTRNAMPLMRTITNGRHVAEQQARPAAEKDDAPLKPQIRHR